MGIFFMPDDYIKNLALNEADDDDEPTVSDPSEDEEDTSDEGEDTKGDEDKNDTNEINPPNEDEDTEPTDFEDPDDGEEPSEDNDDQEDYTINDEPTVSDPSEDDDNADNNSDNNEADDEEPTVSDPSKENIDDSSDEGENTENSTIDDNTDVDNSKIKEIESNIFDMLSEDEKIIKINELKKCFNELNERCENILSMVNKGNGTDEVSIKVLDYVTNTITDLQQYIQDYYTKIFDKKTYIENNAEYQRYLTILASVRSVLNELTNKDKNNDDKK